MQIPTASQKPHLAARGLAALKKLLGRRFAREVMTLQAGSTATMGLQLVTSVIIANLLGPSSLGVYSQATSLLYLVNTLANLAVGQALVTRLAAAHSRSDRGEVLSVVAYFVKVSLAIAVLVSALGLIGGAYLGEVVLADPEIGRMSRILFLSPPLLVGFNLVVLALQSSRQVGRLTLLENGALMGTNLLNLTVVALGGGISGLLFSVALAPLLTSAAALLLYRSTLPRMASFPTLAEVVRAIPKVPFRRYFALSALVSVDKNFANLISQAPTLLLGRFGSDADVAYFRVANNLTLTLLSVPMAPISRNLYAKLAEIRAHHGAAGLRKALIQATAGALAISAAMALPLMVVAPFILGILYRPEYQPALAAMYALGVRCALLGFGVGLGPLYQVLDIMPLAIASKVVPALVMVGGGWLLIGPMGAAGAAWTVTATYLIGDIISALLVWVVLKRPSEE